MSDKAKYIEYVRSENVPLFFKDFWWDALNPHWDVVATEHKGIKAWMPWFYEKHFGFKLVRNPRLTPYSGIITNKETSAEDFKILTEKLITRLPKVAQIDVDLFPFKKELPTFDTYKTTHQLSLRTELESLHANFKSSLKRQLKKAKSNLRVSESEDPEILFDMYAKTFEKRAKKKFLKKEWIQPVWNAGLKNNCSKLLIASDSDSNVHSALWVVFDSEYAYYLLGGSDPKFLGSGSMGLLLWRAIQDAHLRGNKTFDFEGSEIDGIARFFKTFGALEHKVPVLRKNYSPLFSTLQKIKSGL